METEPRLIAAHSAYDKYLIVNFKLVFSHLGFSEWEFLSDFAFS